MDMAKGTIIPDEGTTQYYDMLCEMGSCYTSLEDYDNAKRCYEKAAVIEPDESEPYVGLGIIAMNTGRLEEAENIFNVAKRLGPSDGKCFCGLAVLYQQQGRFDEAFDMYLRSLELNSDNFTALLGLFQLSCHTGSFSRVIHYLNLYLDSHPGDIAVMFCLATLYHRQGDLDRADELLRNILVLDPANKDAADLLEEVEHQLGQKNVY
jgi:tetratricopeptide (TPR) repeat protein